MFKKIISLYSWIKSHYFEFLVILSILIIILLSLFRFKSTGTWSDSYFYLPETNEQESKRDMTSKGEAQCREFLENYFRKSFPKARPDFMVNPVTGSKYNLELDCYNSELNLAVEYNGEQHYKYIPFFHKNKEAFYNQKYRDELKRLRCKELGIKLIEVPYTEKNRIKDFLLTQLKTLGL